MQLKLEVVIIVDEQHQFSKAYLEKKTVLYDVVTSELVFL